MHDIVLYRKAGEFFSRLQSKELNIEREPTDEGGNIHKQRDAKLCSFQYVNSAPFIIPHTRYQQQKIQTEIYNF